MGFFMWMVILCSYFVLRVFRLIGLCNHKCSTLVLSAYIVVRTTSYFYGERHNWGYQNSKTTELIVTKFGTGEMANGKISL